MKVTEDTGVSQFADLVVSLPSKRGLIVKRLMLRLRLLILRRLNPLEAGPNREEEYDDDPDGRGRRVSIPSKRGLIVKPPHKVRKEVVM